MIGILESMHGCQAVAGPPRPAALGRGCRRGKTQGVRPYAGRPSSRRTGRAEPLELCLPQLDGAHAVGPRSLKHALAHQDPARRRRGWRSGQPGSRCGRSSPRPGPPPARPPPQRAPAAARPPGSPPPASAPPAPSPRVPESRHVGPREVLGQVALGKGHDAVVDAIEPDLHAPQPKRVAYPGKQSTRVGWRRRRARSGPRRTATVSAYRGRDRDQDGQRHELQWSMSRSTTRGRWRDRPSGSRSSQPPRCRRPDSSDCSGPKATLGADGQAQSLLMVTASGSSACSTGAVGQVAPGCGPVSGSRGRGEPPPGRVWP